MRSCARCRWVVLLGLAVINVLLLAAGAFDFLSPTVVKSEGGGAPYGASQTLPAKGLLLAPGVPARALHTLHQGWVKRDGRRLPDSSIRVYQVSPEAHEAEARRD